jgi:hypothetical protein
LKIMTGIELLDRDKRRLGYAPPPAGRLSAD